MRRDLPTHLSSLSRIFGERPRKIKIKPAQNIVLIRHSTSKHNSTHTTQRTTPLDGPHTTTNGRSSETRERHSQPRTGKKHHKKKGRMEIRGKSNPVRAIINNASDHTSIELALRTTTRWIDEIWASRIISAHEEDPSFQNLSMDPLADCSDDFCKFIWSHFVTKYGIAQEASIHTGDFITSLRKHRDTSHRVRIFSEFIGVDLRRSKNR